MLLLTTTGIVVAANRAAAALAGTTAEGLRGRPLSAFVDGGADAVARCLHLWARTSDPIPAGVSWRTAEGRIVACRGDGHRVATPEGPALVFVRCWPKGTERTVQTFVQLNERIDDLAQEVRERRRLAEAREQLLLREQAARAEAETATRAKDEFLATLSHELRTPLNAVLGWTQMIRAIGTNPAMIDKALGIIQRNGASLAQLVDDLLDVSRIVAGKLGLDVQTVAVGPVIDAAVDAIRPTARHRGVEIAVALAEGLPPITADPVRLQQVVWNLLSNGVKFTPAGGRVDVSVDGVDGGLAIAVSDTGVGIDADLLPHIFERFRQGDSSSTREHGGLGLGLALVKHIVELHGGRVEARSEGRNKGTTVIVTLPRRV